MRKSAISSCLISLLISTAWLAAPAKAQRQPQSAHVNLYFPQVADGSFAGGRWQTAFTFVNANRHDTIVILNLFDDTGAPFEVDLGEGSKSKHTFIVPAGESLSVASRPTTRPVKSGWALGIASLPLMASSSFRLWLGDRAAQEVTAPPVLPVLDYLTYANRESGVALANPYGVPVSVQLLLSSRSSGPASGPVVLTLPAHGHTAFNVKDKFPAATFADSVLFISGVNRPEDLFLAWTMNADASGTFSSLPPGGWTYPLSHWDRIWNVYLRVAQAAKDIGVLTSTPRLTILSDKMANAFAARGTDVAVTLGLSQLISDSDSEMAHVLGHELGHIVQYRTGLFPFHPNPEFDADVWGTILALEAGYDPYAAAGALAKLSMATGTASLTAQFEAQLSSDAHKSFNERLENVYETLVFACNSGPSIQAVCRQYKDVFHPNLPDAAPLDWGGLEKKGFLKQTEPLRARLRRAAAPGGSQAPLIDDRGQPAQR